MAQEIKSRKPITNGRVLPQDPVIIYGTDSSKNLVTGKAYTVHSVLAAKLIAAGKATKEVPVDAKKKA